MEHGHKPSLTAVRTEPTGQTILLPTEEVAAYEALVTEVNRQFQPSTYTEKLLAGSIVNYEWRLRRIDRLQAVADKMQAPPKLWKDLEKQERFLRRQLKKETAELNHLLKENPRRRGLFLVPKREKLNP